MSAESAHKALSSLVVLTTLVSSMVLVKRLDACVPKEEASHKHCRQAILYLSGLLVGGAALKALAAGVIPQLGSKSLSDAKPFIDRAFHFLSIVVVSLNLYYLYSVNLNAVCPDVSANAPGSGVTDAITTKHLAVCVTILSIVSLLLLVKNGLYLLGSKIGAPKIGGAPTIMA